MGGGISSLFSKPQSQTTTPPPQSNKPHPEDVDKPGLLYPGKESFVSDDFTRWSVKSTMDAVYEKFEELESGNLGERTYLAVVQPLNQQVETWNEVEICPTKDYIKAFIIDYDPTKKGQNVDNLVIYSYLVQAKYENQVGDWLKQEIDKIHI